MTDPKHPDPKHPDVKQTDAKHLDTTKDKDAPVGPGSHIPANQRPGDRSGESSATREEMDRLRGTKEPWPDPTRKTVTGTKLPKTERERIEQEREERPIVPTAAHLPYDVDKPFNVPDPNRPKPTPAEVEREKKQKELLAKIGKIMEEHDSRESNIPANHEYWQLVAQLRAL